MEIVSKSVNENITKAVEQKSDKVRSANTEPSTSELLLDNDWVECFDKKSQRPYYYSKIRKQSVWKPPPAFIYRKQQEKSNILNVNNNSNMIESNNTGSNLPQTMLSKSLSGTSSKAQPITLSVKLTDNMNSGTSRSSIPFTSQKLVQSNNNNGNSPNKAQIANRDSPNVQQLQYQLHPDNCQHEDEGTYDDSQEDGNQYDSNYNNNLQDQHNDMRYKQQEYDNNYDDNRNYNEEQQYHEQEEVVGEEGTFDQYQDNDNQYISDSSQDDGGQYSYEQPQRGTSVRGGGRELGILLEPPVNKLNQPKSGELGYADKFMIEQHKKTQRAASPSSRNIYTNKTALQEYAKAQAMQQQHQQQLQPGFDVNYSVNDEENYQKQAESTFVDDISVVTTDTVRSQQQNRPNSNVVSISKSFTTHPTNQDNSMKWETTIDKNTGRRYWFNR